MEVSETQGALWWALPSRTGMNPHRLWLTGVRRMAWKQLVALLAAALALICQPALAQDDPTAPVKRVSVSATVSATSDYRFRGITLSDRKPALQGSIEVEHRNGLYAGGWGSSIARYAGTRAELDLYGGIRKSLGSIDVDLGGVVYTYPGGHGGNYAELTASAAKTLGPVTATIGAAYAPSQKNIGRKDNRYTWVRMSSGIPGTPVTLSVRAAHEKGSLAGPTGSKWDWSAGAEVVKNRFRLGLEYQDSNVKRRVDPGRTARSALVATLSIDF
jgi:uncharacterized protein (TIGR02001 family)